MYGYFKQQTGEIANVKTRIRLRKGNLKRETESLLIAVENNAIKANYIKAKIYNTQQNIKCKLCGDRDKMVNHILRKLVLKEYKTMYY